MTKEMLIKMGISEENAEKIAQEAEKEAKQEQDSLKSEIESMRTQLDEAKGRIAEFEKEDIEGIKAAAEEWRKKYETETEQLKQTIADKEYDFALEKYMGGYKFSSDLARKAAVSAMREKKFKLDDDGKFLGADDFMAELEKNNPSAFDSEEKGVPVIMTGTSKTESFDTAARSIMGLK